MAKPPTTPPSSDIVGVNRDARVNSPSEGHPDPGGAIDDAKDQAKARPDEKTPSSDRGG